MRACTFRSVHKACREVRKERVQSYRNVYLRRIIFYYWRTACKECMAVRRTGIPCHDRYVFLPDAVLGTGNGRYR